MKRIFGMAGLALLTIVGLSAFAQEDGGTSTTTTQTNSTTETGGFEVDAGSPPINFDAGTDLGDGGVPFTRNTRT